MKNNSLITFSLMLFNHFANAHYPILDCTTSSKEVTCEASFSDKSKAPGVVMEVFSEDDEVIAKGRTDDESKYKFSRPDGVYFIIMDAGPGHVLEISDEDVQEI